MAGLPAGRILASPFGVRQKAGHVQSDDPHRTPAVGGHRLQLLLDLAAVVRVVRKLVVSTCSCAAGWKYAI